MDQISGAYRSTSASQACLSPFAARVTRAVTAGSSRIGVTSCRVGARAPRRRRRQRRGAGEVADLTQALVGLSRHAALPFTGEMGVGAHVCLLPLATRPGSAG